MRLLVIVPYIFAALFLFWLSGQTFAADSARYADSIEQLKEWCALVPQHEACQSNWIFDSESRESIRVPTYELLLNSDNCTRKARLVLSGCGAFVRGETP